MVGTATALTNCDFTRIVIAIKNTGYHAIDKPLKELLQVNEKTEALETYRSYKRATHFYHGVSEVVKELKAKGIKVGIITDGSQEGQGKSWKLSGCMPMI